MHCWRIAPKRGIWRSKRKKNFPLKVAATEEMGRFPPTPKTLIELPATGPSTLQADVDAAKHDAARLLAENLAKSPVKDVFVFVHGYANTFDDSVITIA